jgi:hypothetical protein
MARRPEKPENEPEGAFSAEQWPPIRPDPDPDSAAPVLSRRAARAEREAREALAARVTPHREAPTPDPGWATTATPQAAPPRRSRADRATRTSRPTPADRPDPPTEGGGETGRKAGPRRRRVALWLTVAALVLAAWAATSFIDSSSFAIAGPAAIGPLVTVFALPVIAIGAAGRHIVPTTIAVVAAFLPWTLVTGYAAAGPGRSTIGTGSTLRVMSVDGARGRASAEDITRTTRIYAVDIVVVTELTSELAHELTVAGLSKLAPARWVNVPGDGHGTGLWARPEVNDLTPIDGLSRPGVDGAIVAGPGSIAMSVVHLAGEPLNPGPAWRSDLARLAERERPGLSFIVGDLNAGPWQPAFRKLTSSTWRDASNVVGQGLRPTWPTWSPLPIAPVDHLLVGPGLGVADADTTTIGGSNHRALIVTLIIPHAGG